MQANRSVLDIWSLTHRRLRNDKMVNPALNQGVGYGIVIGLGALFAFGVSALHTASYTGTIKSR